MAPKGDPVAPSFYDDPLSVAAAPGLCTKYKPFDSARTVEVLLEPAFSSKTWSGLDLGDELHPLSKD